LDTVGISVMQTLRLKGRITSERLAEVVGIPVGAVSAELDRMVGLGFVKAGGGGSFRLTAEGQQALGELLRRERADLAHDDLTSCYEEWLNHNGSVKATVTRWQIRPGGAPNDHCDADYDRSVVGDLVTELDRAASVLGRIVAALPRLERYPLRLRTALDRAVGGDQAYVARPTVDSFHQVWFELHEEMIGALGRSRIDEAEAGRA
jgi:hypothetical protein